MSHRTGTPHGDTIRDRQTLLDNRSEHAPKRHRTGKRKSRQSAARRLAGKKRASANLARKRALSAAMAAYFRGETDSVPSHRG